MQMIILCILFLVDLDDYLVISFPRVVDIMFKLLSVISWECAECLQGIMKRSTVNPLYILHRCSVCGSTQYNLLLKSQNVPV
jgi:hypothetical protein